MFNYVSHISEHANNILLGQFTRLVNILIKFQFFNLSMCVQNSLVRFKFSFSNMFILHMSSNSTSIILFEITISIIIKNTFRYISLLVDVSRQVLTSVILLKNECRV